MSVCLYIVPACEMHFNASHWPWDHRIGHAPDRTCSGSDAFWIGRITDGSAIICTCRESQCLPYEGFFCFWFYFLSATFKYTCDCVAPWPSGPLLPVRDKGPKVAGRRKGVMEGRKEVTHLLCVYINTLYQCSLYGWEDFRKYSALYHGLAIYTEVTFGNVTLVEAGPSGGRPAVV